MKRALLIVLLSLGTLGGFAAGCHSLARHRAAYCAGPGSSHPGCSARRAFQDEVADVCVRAARRVSDEQAANATGRSPGAVGADDRAAVAGPGGATISPDRAAAAVDRAAAAVDRAAAAAERAAAAAERSAASVERATLASEPASGAAARLAPQGAAPK